MDPKPNSPNAPSSSTPQALDPNIEISTQDPQEQDPNSSGIGSDHDPKGGGGEGEKEEEEEEEEEAECGFCLFMKGGGCKDQFIAWEKCVEESEKNKDDIAEKCFEVTSLLKKCMDAHADYYEPILRAEKAMAEEAEKEIHEVEEAIVEVEVVSEKESEAEVTGPES